MYYGFENQIVAPPPYNAHAKRGVFVSRRKLPGKVLVVFDSIRWGVDTLSTMAAMFNQHISIA